MVLKGSVRFAASFTVPISSGTSGLYTWNWSSFHVECVASLLSIEGLGGIMSDTYITIRTALWAECTRKDMILQTKHCFRASRLPPFDSPWNFTLKWWSNSSPCLNFKVSIQGAKMGLAQFFYSLRHIPAWDLLIPLKNSIMTFFDFLFKGSKWGSCQFFWRGTDWLVWWWTRICPSSVFSGAIATALEIVRNSWNFRDIVVLHANYTEQRF